MRKCDQYITALNVHFYDQIMAKSLGALLKKRSSAWTDDEPKKSKASGDSKSKVKGEKMDKDKGGR